MFHFSIEPHYFMTKRGFSIYLSFVVLFSILYQPLFAGPTLSQLLTHEILLGEQTVLFEQEAGFSTSIARARIHMLTSDDCQSGYVGVYDTFNDRTVFPIAKGRPFGLNASSTFQAGLSIAGDHNIEKIRSLLIRFLSTEGQFARFTGVCNDQDVNCCVSVICSHQTGTCLATHALDMQFFML